MGSSNERLTKPALLSAMATLSALASSYAEASDLELTDDREAAEAVRSVVESLELFARKRQANDTARARLALATGLRNVYLRVRGEGAADTEAPPSRRTWHEGAWHTDEERRAVLQRMLTRWLPEPSPAMADVDLSSARIAALGDARAAAEHVAAALVERARPGPLVVFGAPVVDTASVAFAAEVLGPPQR